VAVCKERRAGTDVHRDMSKQQMQLGSLCAALASLGVHRGQDWQVAHSNGHAGSPGHCCRPAPLLRPRASPSGPYEASPAIISNPGPAHPRSQLRVSTIHRSTRSVTAVSVAKTGPGRFVMKYRPVAIGRQSRREGLSETRCWRRADLRRPLPHLRLLMIRPGLRYCRRGYRHKQCCAAMQSSTAHAVAPSDITGTNVAAETAHVSAGIRAS